MSANSPISTKRAIGWIEWTVFLAVLLCVIIACNICVIVYSIRHGISAVSHSFAEQYINTSSETNSQFYQSAFDASEAAHHVSNNVSISIKAIQEKSTLEVLHVNDVVYIISDDSSNNSPWLKVPGSGVFTVNLASAEYIIDTSRHYVLVRVPLPSLDSNIHVDLKNVEIIPRSKNSWKWEGSVKAGEEKARQYLQRAQKQIWVDFEENEQYFKIAKSSAESMLIALIKGVNPDIDDLQVEVEFY